jgi:hypothetical protein
MVLGGLGLLLSLTVLCWPFTVDDAFISFRYSENIALGYGPTYNPGVLPHAEGYTSFLWVIIMTLPHLLGWDALLASKLFGICATLAMLGVSAKFVFDLTASLRPATRQVCVGLVVLLLGAFFPVAVHAVSGMETALFAFLLTTFLYLTYRYISSPTTACALLLAGSALLVGLTRPEGNLAAVIALAAVATLVQGKQRRILLLSVALVYIIPAIIYFVWRLSYYGLLFPIPFYVKVAAQSLLAGWRDVQDFAKFLLFHIGVFLVFGFIRPGKALVPAIVSVAALLLFFMFPAAIMGFAWRYCYPVAPFFLVIAVRGFAVMHQWLEQIDTATVQLPLALPYARRAVLPALCIITAFGLVDGATPDIVSNRNYANIWNNRVIPLAQRLHDLTSAVSAKGGGAPLVALIDAGAIPYYSKWQTIDTYTLNDPIIAVAGKVDPEYVLGRKPDLLVLISVEPDKFVPFLPSEEQLYEAAKQQGMVRASSLLIDSGSPYNSPYHYWLMVPSQSPILAQLTQLGSTWK